MKPKYEVGDVLENKWGDVRVIFSIIGRQYYYIYRTEGLSKMTYNPFKPSVGFGTMHNTFSRVGRIKDIPALVEKVNKAAMEIVECLAKAEDSFSGLLATTDIE